MARSRWTPMSSPDVVVRDDRLPPLKCRTLKSDLDALEGTQRVQERALPEFRFSKGSYRRFVQDIEAHHSLEQKTPSNPCKTRVASGIGIGAG